MLPQDIRLTSGQVQLWLRAAREGRILTTTDIILSEGTHVITNADDFFTKGCGRCKRFDTPDCSTKLWQEGLLELRRIMQEMGLEETVKWGHPTYMHAGRNIVTMGAFRGDFRIGFHNASLLKDPEGILVKQGEYAATAGSIKFDSADQARKLEPVVKSYLKEMMGYAEAGIKPEKVVRDIEMPDELAEALDSDPELAEAFHALTPGRQRSYSFNLSTAKKSETRIARIEKFRPKILEGKGAMER